jgi:hypothetical protein
MFAGYNAQNYTRMIAAEVIHSDFYAAALPRVVGDDERNDLPARARISFKPSNSSRGAMPKADGWDSA